MTDSAYHVQTLSACDPLEEWDRFVEESPQGSIFCRSWWLNAVCHDQFRIVTVRRNGRIVGGIPLPTLRKWQYRVVTMPVLTQALGVLLEPPSSPKYETRLSTEMEVTNRVIQAMPRVSLFSMNFHYNFSNWLPFYWAGYGQTTRYTYVLADLSDIPRLYGGLSQKQRNSIKKAMKLGITIAETEDLGLLLEMNRRTYARQGLGVPYPEALVARIDKECSERHARKIFVARDTIGRVHSALYVVYDSKSMYNLIQGADPQLRESCANPLAMWHSIEFAHEVTKRYDFEGSMMPNVEPFYRSFGGVQMPYFNVTKNDLPGMARLCLKMPWMRSVVGKIVAKEYG